MSCVWVKDKCRLNDAAASQSLYSMRFQLLYTKIIQKYMEAYSTSVHVITFKYVCVCGESVRKSV